MASKNDIRIDVNQLHPWLRYKLSLFLKRCNKKGIYLIVTEGYRTVEYQDSLYAKGRTKSGKIVTNARGRDYASQHQWRIAFDIAINYDVDGDGKTTDDTWNPNGFREAAKIAKKLGLGWGGDWTSPVDMPHLYLKKWGSTTSKLKSTYGTPDLFKKTFTAKVTRKKGVRIWNEKKWSTKKTSDDKALKNVAYKEEVNVMYKKVIGWSKVEYKGTVGWIKSKYLK